LVKKVISSLESLGFLINFKKSVTTLSQCIEYIGLIPDSLAMSFRLTDKKIADISRLCKEAIKKHSQRIPHFTPTLPTTFSELDILLEDYPRLK
jgi:hypothetical protein